MNDISPSQVVEDLQSSEIFQEYSTAFEVATGLRLGIQLEASTDSSVVINHVDQPVAFLHIYTSLKKPRVSPERLRSALVLVRAFSIQLGEQVGSLLLEESGAEPVAIVQARRYIIENLDEPLTLQNVANEVKVSRFYFCKLFRSSTGMTFTEFVNRQRVERAKRRLLDPALRITEIAYEVGYQSLSQFNRNFQRIVGESPTQFRKRLKIDRSPSRAEA